MTEKRMRQAAGCPMEKREIGRMRRALAEAGTLCLGIPSVPHIARAQSEEPAISTECSKLRQSTRTLNPRDGRYPVVGVVGELTTVRKEGGAVYLSMCNAPDLQVVCITDETNGNRPGDNVVVSGTMVPRGPNMIQLDPCEHHPPD